MRFLVPCLFVRGSLLLFGDLLIDVEDARDVELHAVEVVSNHSPQLVQTRVTRLCNLRGAGNRTSHEKPLWVYQSDSELEGSTDGVGGGGGVPYLHNLPWHVKDAACRPAQEAPQTSDGAIPDDSSPYSLCFAIQHPPSLLSLLPLLQLQLPLLFMVSQPH